VPDIRPWVAKAAVYTVPLRVGGGTRLKMVDAMAQGKAIVATRVGAEGIAGEDGRHFLLADAPEAFAGRVIALLRDEQARRRLGAAAREQAERVYAWPLVGRTLAAAYADAVERTKGR
jgi:glycosyltransferase involved in cell wall biosynthesis